MVGLVLVSHSPRLALGLTDLLAELGTDEVPIVVAAGTVDGRLGTSPDRVAAALAAADRGDGVVVVADLGSAVLTARLVLEDADPARPATSRRALADCPFVEGAVAAAVTAATGADLEAVVRAAEGARDLRKW